MCVYTHNINIYLYPISYILPDASRQSGQKTRMVKHSISPTYNHTMVYDGFHTSDLREACAELTVWHREMGGLKTHKLGGIRLSSGTGECLSTLLSLLVQVHTQTQNSIIISLQILYKVKQAGGFFLL